MSVSSGSGTCASWEQIYNESCLRRWRYQHGCRCHRSTVSKNGRNSSRKRVFFFPGGKGSNQAVSAAKLGAPTTLIGCLGEDAFGRELSTFLSSQGIDLTNVRYSTESRTETAVITVVESDNAIVVIPGTNALVNGADVARPALAKGDVLVSQFEIPASTVHAFFSRAGSIGATTILNPAPAIDFDRSLLHLVDILVLNETELGFMTRRSLHESDPKSFFIEAARSLQMRDGQTVCVTLGRRGAVALNSDGVITIPGRAVQPVDTTGAGDCFVGALAAQIAAGATIIIEPPWNMQTLLHRCVSNGWGLVRRCQQPLRLPSH